MNITNKSLVNFCANLKRSWRNIVIYFQTENTKIENQSNERELSAEQIQRLSPFLEEIRSK